MIVLTRIQRRWIEKTVRQVEIDDQSVNLINLHTYVYILFREDFQFEQCHRLIEISILIYNLVRIFQK